MCIRDSLRAAVRMQPYELCLRVLQKYFAGLLEARKDSRQASYEALAAIPNDYRGKGVSSAVNQIVHPKNSLGVWCVEDTM